MTASVTYTSLLGDIRAYLDRGQTLASDPVVYAQLPRLVNLAERRIAYDLQIEGMQEVVQTAMQPGVAVMPKPDRWRRTVSMNIGTGTAQNTRVTIFPRSYEYLRTFWPDDQKRGQPRFYADYDYAHWVFGPTPDAAYPIEISYYAQPILLGESTPSNWLTELAPNLLLFATLSECSPFMRDDDRTQVWEGKYQQILQSMNVGDLKKVIDRSTTRMGA